MTPRTFTPVIQITFTLLLLIASGSSARAQPGQQEPHILFAEAPARLIRIDGAPVYRHIPDTDLERIVNTRALIVRDVAGLVYLKVLDGWMESYDLTGDWSVSGASPFGENTKIERAVLASTVDRLDGRSRLDDHPPTILISTGPAALIVTDGPPRYETITGTSLRYLANSDSKVYLEPTDGETYVRIDGEWYRAWTTDGPWESIPSNELPQDIARQIAR